jgi:4-amino-4-deoxy-L-arabinose transferase-like glycosyltransferase
MVSTLRVSVWRSVRSSGAKLRWHAGFLAVLLAAGVLRAGAELAYRPALFFSDSWVYLSTTFAGTPVGIVPSRPSGYPLFLRLLTLPRRDVLLATIVQHLAGVVVGALVYLLLLHLGQRRIVAVAAAGLVLLDSYAIALEQFIMAEALFTLLVVAALALTVLRRASPRALMVAGALLAVACTVRTAGLFVIPIWLGYLMWSARDRRRLMRALTGLILPLVFYGSWHALRTDGSFSLDQADGWFLYGRIAQIADCHGAHVPPATLWLCNPPLGLRRYYGQPGAWIWDPGSPPQWVTGGNPDFYAGKPGGAARTAHNNQMLEDFALAIIRAHPLAYATTAAADFLRFFDPTASAYSDPDGATVTFPSAPLTGWLSAPVRNRYLPHYIPRVHWPAPALLQYQRYCPDPRLVLGGLTVFAFLALLAPILTLGRLQVEHRPEILLLTGSGLAMLLASAAFVAFVVRYLVPAIPLITCGGLVAVRELILATRTHMNSRLVRVSRRISAEDEGVVAGGV